MNYTDKLKNIIAKNKSNLVIGLDSDQTKIPDIFFKYKNPVSVFNKLIVESTIDLAAGYKLNAAFYECLMEEGVIAMRQTMNIIPDDMVTICDAKRGDIDTSAEMYAQTYFDLYNFDSITISPYMGRDAVEPFFKRKDKFVYILALTSNTGHSDFQKLKVGERYLYEEVIDKSLTWNKENKTGFVFGANHTEEIKKFTSTYPDIPLLIPGIGAQSNDLKNLMNSLHSNNSFVINSSRGIIYSSKKDCTEKEFTDDIRNSALKLNLEINALKK
ncbi:MAG TPA: orotidine-5'-phosphate decarboxylase [Ignavibacteria bacterium]|nr:orotidine-5'-phosphate decarboxylase [Ignavibacteria bacterium]